MHMHLSVGYSTLFDEPAENVESLLADIPSKYVIGLLSIISNILERKGDSLKTQLYIYDVLSVNFPTNLRQKLWDKMIYIANQQGSFSLFANRYVVEMINREYMRFSEKEGLAFKVNLTSYELNIFKAYCIVLDET